MSVAAPDRAEWRPRVEERRRSGAVFLGLCYAATALGLLALGLFVFALCRAAARADRQARAMLAAGRRVAGRQEFAPHELDGSSLGERPR